MCETAMNQARAAELRRLLTGTKLSARARRLEAADGWRPAIDACSLAAPDDALTAAYRELLAKLEEAPVRESLRAAQRAWLAFRDRQCVFERGDQARCRAALTRERVGELRGRLL